MFSACYAVSVLVVSLSLCNSAPTTTTEPKDCEASVTPVVLDNPAKMSGRWNFIEGFADNDLFNSIMKRMDSAWMVITESPQDSNSTLTMMEYNRINGTCYMERCQITLASDTTMDFTHNTDKDPNIHIGDINKGTLLPTCVNCLVFNFTTSLSGVSTPIHTLHLLDIGDINKGTLLPTCVNCLVFNFTTSLSGVSTPIHTLHLLAREQSMQESDLLAFRQQAKCLNFSLPASFHYKQGREFCAEDNVTVAPQKEQNHL